MAFSNRDIERNGPAGYRVKAYAYRRRNAGNYIRITGLDGELYRVLTTASTRYADAVPSIAAKVEHSKLTLAALIKRSRSIV